MPTFERAQRKRREEPAGLDAFAAGAAVTPVILRDTVRERPTPEPEPSPEGPRASARKERGGKGLSMNVRFTPEEKAALQRLADAEERSMQQVLMRLAGPVILEAARKLG